MTTPTDPGRSCAIASFKIEGRETEEVISKLYENTRVFAVIRYLEDDEVVRVTPSLYNLTDELDALLDGIKSIA